MEEDCIISTTPWKYHYGEPTLEVGWWNILLIFRQLTVECGFYALSSTHLFRSPRSTCGESASWQGQACSFYVNETFYKVWIDQTLISFPRIFAGTSQQPCWYNNRHVVAGGVYAVYIGCFLEPFWPLNTTLLYPTLSFSLCPALRRTRHD